MAKKTDNSTEILRNGIEILRRKSKIPKWVPTAGWIQRDKTIKTHRAEEQAAVGGSHYDEIRLRNLIAEYVELDWAAQKETESEGFKGFKSGGDILVEFGEVMEQIADQLERMGLPYVDIGNTRIMKESAEYAYLDLTDEMKALKKQQN